MINWPRGIPPLGPNFQFHSLNKTQLQALVDALGLGNSEVPEIEFEPWTEGELFFFSSMININ